MKSYDANGRLVWDRNDMTIDRLIVLESKELLAMSSSDITLLDKEGQVKDRPLSKFYISVSRPSIFLRRGKLYIIPARHRVSGKMGILEYRYPLSPIATKGWPTPKGSVAGYRRQP